MKPSVTGVVAAIIVIVLAAGLAGYAAQGRLGPTASTTSTGQVQTMQNATSSSLGSLSTSTTVLASSSTSGSNQTVATNSTATTSEATSTNATSSSSCTTPVDTNSTDGLTIQTFLPASITMGDSACIKAILSSNDQTTISSLSGNITITNAQGDVVFQSALVPFEAGSLELADGNQLSFQFLWNTSVTYEGMTPQPGLYTVVVMVQFDGLQPLTHVESDSCLTLATDSTGTAASVNSSTLSDNGTTASACPTPVDTNSNHGLALQTYLQPIFPIGGSMSITASLVNGNETTISSLSGNVTIRDSQGGVVFSDAVVPFEAGSVELTTGHEISFQFLWNTTASYLGITPQPGIYAVTIILQFDGMQPTTYIESNVNFTLTG
jgi:hypothetical protein